MWKHSLKFRLQIGFGILLIAVCLLLVGCDSKSSSSSAAAQNSQQPSVSPPSASVVRGGYRLNPSGLTTDKWPTVGINFSIARSEDETFFQELSIGDIDAELNGAPLALGPNALQRNLSPISVIFMVDRSGSMIDTDAGINKLKAATESLKDIIRASGPNDLAAVGAFDSTQDIMVELTSNKSALNSGIGRIAPTGDIYTYLYDAIDFALREAEKKKIKNIVLLSDGWEDTKESRKMEKDSPSQFESFKRQREDAIVRASRANAIRIYTIAIGARGDKQQMISSGQGKAFVDYESLCRIAGLTNGGFCKHVDMPRLKAQSGNDITRFNSLIKTDLEQVLTEIRKTFHYDYSLAVGFPRDLKHEDGELKLNFMVDKGRVKLPVIFPYTWDQKTNRPVFGDWQVSEAIFIQKPSATLPYQSITGVYLLLLMGLGMFALVPFAFNRAALFREMKQVGKSVVQVEAHSDLVGKQCPNELGEWGKRFAFKPGDSIIICPNPKCLTPHHLSCWEYNQHQCMNRACERPMKVPARIMAKYGIGESTREHEA